MTSSFFGQLEQAGKFLGADQEQTSVRVSGPNELVSPTYSRALGKPILEVEAEMSEGLTPLLYSEASRKANELSASTATDAITAGIESQDLTIEQIKQLSEGLMFEDHVAPDIAAMMADNPELTAKTRRALERAMAAERIVADRINVEGGFWAGLGRFGDAAIQSAVRNVAEILPGEQGGGSTLIALAQEASNLLIKDMPKEEFEQEFSSILDRVSDLGYFTDENPFILGEFIGLVQESGVGTQSDWTKFFQVADVVTLGTGATAKATFSTAARLPKLVTGLRGTDDAVEMIVETAKAGIETPMLQTGLDNGMIRLNNELYSHPSMEVMRQLEAENQALKIVKGAQYGSRVAPEIVERMRGDIIAEITERNKTYRRNSIDYGIRQSSDGSLYGSAVLGKSATGGATPYVNRQGAQRLADAVGGEVHEVVEGGKTGYVVLREWDIPTAGLADPTDVDALASGPLSRVMSTTARTTPFLDSLVKQGEMQTARVNRILAREYQKARRKITKDFTIFGRKLKEGEEGQVNNILVELQSDPNFSMRKEPYTPVEFATRYEELYGKPPRQEVVDFYEKVLELNDVDYHITASALRQEAVDNGETMLQLGEVWYRSKPVTGLADDTPVWYADTSTMQKLSDIKQGTVVYEVQGAAYKVEGVGNIRYVVANKPITRRLYNTDVLAYNAGGHRRYTDITGLFLKQTRDDLNVAGGMTMPRRPITFMAVRTEKEAADVAESWNTIAKAVNDEVDNIDDVIRTNNKWNVNIETYDDLVKFADTHGLDIKKEIGIAPDGEPILGTAGDGFAGNATIGDQFRSGFRDARSRGSAPLVGYGGENLNILEPSKAINRGFTRTLTQRGDANYLFNAINGWLKAAKKEGVLLNPDEIAGLSPKQAMLKAQLSKTKTGRALSVERDTISRRMSHISAQVAQERSIMKAFADFLYEKDKKKLAKLADYASDSDPAGFMRALAFHTKLGMFAIDQVYVQASQMVNVVGITQATLGVDGAIRGALGNMPLRLLLVDDMTPAFRSRVANIQSAFTGISPQEMLDLADWVKRTGRNVVDHTVVEENNLGVFSTGNRALNAGQFFFNEGELLARLSAATTSFLERKAKYKVVDLMDERTTRQLIERQDVLTASMTSASAAPWQRSLWAVPLQFTTYHVRMAEQIFTSKILTPKERQRLLFTHFFFYGAAGVPAAGFIADRLAHNEQVDPNNPMFDVVRYGMMDASLSLLTGADTALSTRLAVGEGLFDLFYDLQDKGVLEFAAGPSGQIAIDSASAFNAMVRNIFQGEGFDHLAYDWNRLARNVTGYNRAHTAYTLAKYDAYYSRKTEQAQAEGLPTPEKLAVAMGIPLKDQHTLWAEVGNIMLDDKGLERDLKEIKRLETIGLRLLEQGDNDGAADIFADMGAVLATMTPSQRTKAMQRLRQHMTIHESITRRLMQDGKIDIANYLMELTNG